VSGPSRVSRALEGPLQGPALMVAGTLREEEVAAGSVLGTLIKELQREGVADLVGVPPLSRADTIALGRALLGRGARRAVGPDATDALWEVSIEWIGGATDEAERHLGQAVEVFRSITARFLQAHAQILLAEILASRGAHTAASGHLREAYELCVWMKVPPASRVAHGSPSHWEWRSPARRRHCEHSKPNPEAGRGAGLTAPSATVGRAAKSPPSVTPRVAPLPSRSTAAPRAASRRSRRTPRCTWRAPSPCSRACTRAPTRPSRAAA
jgi:hypothetical protein